MTCGKQTPRIRVEPERITTDGPDAATLMEAYGYKLDPWQKLVLDAWLGKDQSYTTTSAGLALPRQNGKNTCLEAREFFGLVINGEKILHTSHQVRTSKEAFRRLVNMFSDDRHPEIKALVAKIRYTNGEERIELNNGGCIMFSARSRQAARGIDGISLVVFDEAQELQDDQVEAIMATLSASATGTRQIVYTGTPPYPGCPGDVFRRRREKVLKEPGPHDSWHEWSVDAVYLNEIDTSDKTLWYDTNPALGYRLTEEFTAEEAGTMSKDGFARERLGWWQPQIKTEAEYCIEPDLWASCKSKDPKPDGKVAFGIKFNPDGTEVALAGAVLPKDGPARITLLEHCNTGTGLQWLADFLNVRYKTAACVAIDGRNGVDVLIGKIEKTWRVKDSVIKLNSSKYMAAVGTLMDALQSQTVTWYAEQDELKTSALTSTKRPFSGGWGFGGEDPLPIEAAAIALWAVKNTRREPGKKMRIG